VLTPTLALTSIAGATPPEWDVEYWDENLLQGSIPVDPFPGVVGITVHLTFAERAFAIADWFRARGAVVILGGLHVLTAPEECAAHADAIVVGEGVQVWPRVLADVAAGTLQRVYHGSYVAGAMGRYADEPAPRRELVPAYGFLTRASLIATRGCHNRCGFCYLSTDGLHMPYQMRAPEDIARQFASTGEPYGVFIDNNLGSKPEYLRELCRALRPLNKIWSAAITIDVTDDPSLVRDMALSGCTGVFVGFESLSADNLDDARKKTPRPDDYARRVALLHRWRIQVNGSFVFGFDRDDAGVFDRTVRWIQDNHLECATFHILTPYPGTPLFAQLEREGRILHRDWNRYDTAHVVFQPKLMTPRELYEGYAATYRRLFSHDSIWRRRPAGWTNAIPYLCGSYLYKKSNRLWPWIIRLRLTHALWSPLVELSRRKHVRWAETQSAEPHVMLSGPPMCHPERSEGPGGRGGARTLPPRSLATLGMTGPALVARKRSA